MRGTAVLLLLAPLACAPDPGPDPAELEWSVAFEAKDVGWLLSAFGPTANQVVAVGGSPASGRIMRFDGSAWAPSDPPSGTPLINWAFGFAPNDLYFAGGRGTILHYDGASYTRSATLTDQNLWGIWGASPSALWAVGGDGVRAGQATILRSDGQRWEKVQIPALQHPDVFAFYKVWGSSADDVYVVGQRGVVLHWDGAAFTELFVGASQDLISLWGTGPDHLAIVGGRANAELITFDGTSWKRRDLGAAPGLNGVFMTRPDQTHVVGQNGFIGRFDWGPGQLTKFEPLTGLALHAVFGDASGRLFAVGGSLGSIDGPFHGVALTRKLSADERSPSPHP